MELKELKKTLHAKVEEGAFGPADIPDYLRVFCAIGNSSAAVQQEAAGWSCRVQLDLGAAGTHWITAANGVFESGAGPLEGAELTLGMDPGLAAKIFSGEKDAKAAYLMGQLKVGGALMGAMKFQTIVGIVAEELESAEP